MAYIQKDKVEAREAYKNLTTSEKMGHLWHYFKWYVIIALFVLFAAGTFIHGAVTQVNPDLTILYLSREHVPREHIAALEEKFSEHVEDANDDGRMVVAILHMMLINPEDNLRLQTQLSTGDAKLFIADDMLLEALKHEGVVELSAPITNREYFEQTHLFAATSVVYVRNTRGRHAERHEREHENAEKIFRLLTE